MTRVRPEPPFLIFSATVPHTVDVDNGGAWTPIDLTFASMGGSHWSIDGSGFSYDDEIGSYAFGSLDFVAQSTQGIAAFEARSVIGGVPNPNPIIFDFTSPATPIVAPGTFATEVPDGGPMGVTFEVRKITGPAGADFEILRFEGHINGRWR